MSIKVFLRDIPYKQYLKHRKDLKLEIHVPFNKFSGKKPKPPEIVDFIYQEDDYIKLPFFYARCQGYENRSDHLSLKKVGKITNKIKLKPEQVPWVSEAADFLIEHRCVTLGTYPGSGKSIMAAELAFHADKVTCFVTKNVQIYNGWVTTLRELFPDAIIWCTKDKFKEIPHFIVAMDGAVAEFPPEIIQLIGTLVIDEIQDLCTKTRAKVLLNIDPQYLILLSATLYKDNNLHLMAEKLAGKHGVFITCRIPHNVYVIKTGIKMEEKRNRKGHLIISSVYTAISQNKKIRKIQTTIINNNKHRKFLSLLRVKEGIEEFVDYSRKKGIETDSMYGNKKRYDNSHFLIGTIPKMGTGFDEKRACHDFANNPQRIDTIFFPHPIKSWTVWEQARGRGLRSDAPNYVILLFKNQCSITALNGLKKHIGKTNGNIIYLNDYKDLKLPSVTKIDDMKSIIKDSKSIVHKNKGTFLYWMDNAEDINFCCRKDYISCDKTVSKYKKYSDSQILYFSDVVKDLDRIFKKSNVITKVEINVKRCLTKDIYSSLHPGDIIKTGSYIGVNYGKFDKKYGNFRMIIKVPEDFKMLHLSHRNKTLILPPTKLKFTKKENDIYYFELLKTYSYFT